MKFSVFAIVLSTLTSLSALAAGGIYTYDEGLQDGRNSCGLAYLKVNPHHVSSPESFPSPPPPVPGIPQMPVYGVVNGDDGYVRGSMECTRGELLIAKHHANWACVVSTDTDPSSIVGAGSGASSAAAGAAAVKSCVAHASVVSCFRLWISCFRGN